MSKRKYILSPCGTSLLRNQAQGNEQQLVSNYANKKNKNDVPENDKAKLTGLISNISERLEKASCQEAQKMSAELNGIIQIYGGSIATNNNDYHLLLSTDTWLGEETAKLVEEWLKKNKSGTISIHRQRDLQTKDMAAFQLSLSDLIKKFDEELPEYSQSGYKIIFNLTGGFKSVQSFLQSISNFYADEAVYIFEKSSELLRIPRLPIRMDAERTVEKNITYFRNLAMGLPTLKSSNIPDTLLLKLGEEITFSPWGELIWSKSQPDIYKKSLFPSPRPEKIRYSKNFEKSAKALPPDRLEIINKRIDQLNKYLSDNTYNPPSLDFKQLKGKPFKNSTHEIDAWSDSDAKRIFGHFEGDCFVLDALDKGLH